MQGSFDQLLYALLCLALLAGPKQSGLLSLAQHLHLALLTIGYHIAAADSMRCAHHHHCCSGIKY
jgi:hypothetical protein